MEKYELFERFIKNEMDDIEKTEFNKSLINDPAFANEFEKHKQLFEVITDSGLIDFKMTLQKVHYRNRLNNKIIKYSAGVVTSIIAVCLLYFAKNENKETPFQNKINDSIELTKNTNITNNEAIYKTDTIQNILKPIIKAPSEKSVSAEINIPEAITKHNTIISDDINTVQNIIEGQDKVKIKEEKAPVKIMENKCKDIEISAVVLTQASCNNKPSGIIEIKPSSIYGGTAPYKISINKGSVFQEYLKFDQLKAGTYQLVIKDINDCESVLGPYYIDFKDCTYEYVFAPLKMETWKVPADSKSCKLYIYSKTGNLVFSREIGSYENYEWNGESLENEILAMGIYKFVIKFNEGPDFSGFVTIIK